MLVREPLYPYLHTILRPFQTISITGAGGKTTLMKNLAKFYREENLKVMLSTTTHLAKDMDYGVDEVIKGPLSYKGGKSVLFVNDDKDNEKKYKCPNTEHIGMLARYFDKVLIEADGSATRPLKYHREDEPVIVSNNNWSISVIGADAFDERIENVMHNYELYFAQFPQRKEKNVDFCDLENLIYSDNGIYKCLHRERTTLILNKIDLITDMMLLSKIVPFARKFNILLASFEKNILISDNIT